MRKDNDTSPDQRPDPALLSGRDRRDCPCGRERDPEHGTVRYSEAFLYLYRPDRLEKDLYKDYGALNVDEIKGGAVTATQILAAYEPLNEKADDYEYCILQFIQGILKVAGIEDNPTFTRSRLINVSENVQTVLQAATALDGEYVTRKILTLLGDGDQADEIIRRKDEEDMDRMREEETEEETEGEGENPEGAGQGGL